MTRHRPLLDPARLVLVAAFVVLLFSSGARFAMGLMLHPMALDLGWSRTTLSSAVTLFMIVSASALPFAGRLVDKFGASRVLAIGVLVSGAAIALMGGIETPLQAWLLYGIAFAIGGAATSLTPIGVMLTHWYPARVGMANSIAISGMGVGQLVIIAALASQLATLGWRGAFMVLGIATVACVLPLVMIAGRHVPPSANAGGTASGVEDARGVHSLRQMLSTRRAWLLLVVYAICGFQDFFVATHIVAFGLDEGLDPLLGGNMLALMGLAGLIGVLVTGRLNDRYGPVLPTAICFLARIVIFALLLLSRHPLSIVAAALLYGMTFWITAPLAVVFARRMCGLALLGTLSGFISMVHQFAGGIGAWFGAWVFDSFGTYDAALAALLVLSAAALAVAPALPRQ